MPDLRKSLKRQDYLGPGKYITTSDKIQKRLMFGPVIRKVYQVSARSPLLNICEGT